MKNECFMFFDQMYILFLLKFADRYRSRKMCFVGWRRSFFKKKVNDEISTDIDL